MREKSSYGVLLTYLRHHVAEGQEAQETAGIADEGGKALYPTVPLAT